MREMSEKLLSIRNLHASVEGQSILNGIDLDINPGEVHVLMGPNGAGKSTLANVILGDPRYEVTEGSIFFGGADITEEKTDARARRGIFLSFQAPEEISGVTVESFLRAAKNAQMGEAQKLIPFRRVLQAKMAQLGIPENYASRYLNVGFSGGEKKKNEILQMEMLNPKLAILDETDSGLDIDAVRTIAQSVDRFRSPKKSILIITHITRILQDLPVDHVHILSQGRIVRTEGADIIDEVARNGFASVLA